MIQNLQQNFLQRQPVAPSGWRPGQRAHPIQDPRPRSPVSLLREGISSSEAGPFMMSTFVPVVTLVG
jgi:hypothetical protein